jgi:putative ABC transport system substrate-binding protein
VVYADEPLLPPPGKIFQVACLKSSDYWLYDSIFTKLRAALNARGWGDAIVFPDTLQYSLESGSYSLDSGSDTDSQASMVRNIWAQGGFDLLFSFGTSATQRVLNENPGTIPVVGGAISDPVSVGFVSSKTDSGVDNFTTALNDNPGSSMFLALHRIVNFKKIGILYTNTKFGRSFAFVDAAVEVAREIGFEVLSYPDLSSEGTVEECLAGVKNLYVRGADVIFFGGLTCIDLTIADPTPVYDFLDSKNIPVFVADDRNQVKKFATLGVVNFNNDEVASFHADQVIRILSGAKPRDLPMIVPFNFRLLVNLEAVRQNKLNLPLDVLLIADEIYMRRLRGGK